MNWKYFFRFIDSRFCVLALAYKTHFPSPAGNDSATIKDSADAIPKVDVTIEKCKKIIMKKITEFGAPGLAIGVSVNGKNVWTDGFGFADIENNVPCTADTVMRIASISKSFTMAAVAKLLENGKIDLDKEVQDYVPEFPKKYFENKEVKITTRMLLSQTSGIRHYHKKEVSDSKGSENKVTRDEFGGVEYYSMKNYKSVIESLDMFKNDELFHKPGEKFLYTTHGWTLVSAVVERASGENFIQHMKKLFTLLGMNHTVPEQYTRNSNGRLVNTPYVDNSYKWAGGGFLSTVSDILRFGNVMLYCYQAAESSQENNRKILSAFLKPETARELWSPASYPALADGKLFSAYGMGWYLQPEKEEFVHCRKEDFQIAHTGGAIGGSSILYILPTKTFVSNGVHFNDSSRISNFEEPRTCGIVVAILTNLQNVNLTFLAKDIAEEFKNITNK